MKFINWLQITTIFIGWRQKDEILNIITVLIVRFNNMINIQQYCFKGSIIEIHLLYELKSIRNKSL